eukprot:jgi/Psemu1/29531/gm1.29531_g
MPKLNLSFRESKPRGRQHNKGNLIFKTIPLQSCRDPIHNNNNNNNWNVTGVQILQQGLFIKEEHDALNHQPPQNWTVSSVTGATTNNMFRNALHQAVFHQNLDSLLECVQARSRRR